MNERVKIFSLYTVSKSVQHWLNKSDKLQTGAGVSYVFLILVKISISAIRVWALSETWLFFSSFRAQVSSVGCLFNLGQEKYILRGFSPLKAPHGGRPVFTQSSLSPQGGWVCANACVCWLKSGSREGGGDSSHHQIPEQIETELERGTIVIINLL